MKRLPFILVLLLIVTLIATFAISPRNEISKNLSEAELIALREKESYEFVAGSKDDLTRRLFTEQIKHGTSIDSVLPLFSPITRDSYGPYSVYQFDEKGYSWRTLVTRADRVIQASVGGCTWNWVFFDFLPADDAIKIGNLREVREYVLDHPEKKARLEPLIQELISSLEQPR
jgi:hypothetical protein